MSNTIVVYFSRKGSNKYLAEKISKSLSCELEEIKPRLNVFLLFLMNIHFGIKILRHKIKDYNRVVLCGPIWIGKLIPPLRSFIKRYAGEINKLIFVTCCGSSDEKKDDKFGHALVFKEVEKILGYRSVLCQAFPIGLVLPENEKENPDAFMKTQLNDENFKGEIQERYEKFIHKLTESENQ